MMTFAFVCVWGILLHVSWKSRDSFLFFFTATQFVFVGLGLVLFPMLGREVLKESFSSFDFSTIDNRDFELASITILLGVAVVVGTFFFLKVLVGRPRPKCIEPQDSFPLSTLSRTPLQLCSTVAIAVCTYFIARNAGDFLSLATARSAEEMDAAVELRRDAVSDYFVTLMIYSFCPAVAIALLQKHLSRRRFSTGLLCFTVSALAAVSLTLTFQKRPLMVFIIALWFTWRHGKNYSFSHYRRAPLLRVVFREWQAGLIFVGILFCLYYFYMGFMAADEKNSDAVATVFDIIGSRIIGRLSLPAAFYVDYFPSSHDFYWFTNSGLLAKLIGFAHFPDTQVVFAAYSSGPVEGTVAASVFTDSYGQGGLLWTPVVGVVVAAALFVISNTASWLRPGASKLLFSTFAFIFIFYLSQASLFRALLGYGGVIYILVWFLLVKKQFRNER